MCHENQSIFWPIQLTQYHIYIIMANYNRISIIRCSTLGLVMALGLLYKDWFFFFQCYAVLDIASHWLHLTAAHYSGNSSIYLN